MAHVMTYEDLQKEWDSASDTIEVHTSGSTGTPKIISLKKDFVTSSALRTNAFFRLNAESRLHSCVSPDFIGGKMMGIRAWLAGAELTWEKPTNRILRDIDPKAKIDLLAVVPSQMVEFLACLDRGEKMPKIEAIIIGGSALHPCLHNRIARSGLRAFETYGMSETASHIALRPIVERDTAFHTLDGIKVSIDSRGCLVINFSSGEQIVTNDLAELEDEENFRIFGRIDHVIVTGGRKVNPLSVEQRLASIIKTSFIIDSVPDEKWGEKIVLRIEGSSDDSDEEIMGKMRELLKPWERPKSIEHVATLARTMNGKLLRQRR